MTEARSLASAYERFERLDAGFQPERVELLADDRLSSARSEVMERVRDRLRAAQMLPTGSSWAVFHGLGSGSFRELLGSAGEVVAAGTLGATGWSLVDVVGFLASGGQSGAVTVHGDERRSVYLRQGDVVWATSSATGERLGSFLLGRGKITREQLHAALRDGPGTMVRACVERGYLAQSELEELLRAFVLERFEALLAEPGQTWSFSRLPDDALEPAPTEMPTQMLLVDALRRSDEMQVYRQRIPGPEAVVRRTGPRASRLPSAAGAPSTALPEAAREQIASQSPEAAVEAEVILAHLPGATSIRELSRRTGIGTFELTRTAYLMARAQVLEVAGGGGGLSKSAHPIPRRDVIAIYLLALGEMAEELEKAQRLPELITSVNGFLEHEAESEAALLAGMQLGPDGRIDAERLSRRAEALSLTDEELSAALGELLFWTLLRSSELLGRAAGDDLARRIRMIHAMLHPADKPR